MLGQIGSGYMR